MTAITAVTAGTARTGSTRPRAHGPRPARRAPRPGGSRHPRTVRRRRVVAGSILAVLVAVGFVVAHDVLAGSGGVPASAAVSRPARVRTTLTAQPGDTLWSIAERFHGEVAITRYVDRLVDLNGGPSIVAGQLVLLP